jgi:hypothetical protein
MAFIITKHTNYAEIQVKFTVAARLCGVRSRDIFPKNSIKAQKRRT